MHYIFYDKKTNTIKQLAYHQTTTTDSVISGGQQEKKDEKGASDFCQEPALIMWRSPKTNNKEQPKAKTTWNAAMSRMTQMTWSRQTTYSSAAYLALVIGFGTILHPELKAFYRHGHGSRLGKTIRLRSGRLHGLLERKRAKPVHSQVLQMEFE